jgi:hypothetical protein
VHPEMASLVPRFEPTLIEHLTSAAPSSTGLPLVLVLTCLARKPFPAGTLSVKQLSCDAQASGELLRAAGGVVRDYSDRLSFAHADEAGFPARVMEINQLPAVVIFTRQNQYVVTHVPNGTSDWAATMRWTLEEFIAGSLPAHVRSAVAEDPPSWSLKPRQSTAATLERDVRWAPCALLLVHSTQAAARSNTTDAVHMAHLAGQLAYMGHTPPPIFTFDLSHNDLPASTIGAQLRELVHTHGVPSVVGTSSSNGTGDSPSSGSTRLHAVPARRVRSAAALLQWATAHMRMKCADASSDSSSRTAAGHHEWLADFVDDGLPMLQDGLQALLRKRHDARVRLYASEILELRERLSTKAVAVPAHTAHAAEAEWLQESEREVDEMIKSALHHTVHVVAGDDARALAEDTGRRMAQLHAARIQIHAMQQLLHERAQSQMA